MTDNTVNYIIKGLLTIGIVILFIFQFKERKTGQIKVFEDTHDSIPLLPVAYINADSLLLSYYLAIDLRSLIVVQEENARSIIAQRMNELEVYVNRYKQNREGSAYYSVEQSDLDYQQILKKRQEILQLNEKLSLDLRNQQDRVFRQLYDSIIYKLEVYNDPYKYKIIFSSTSGDNILYAKKWYNITQSIIEFMNHDFTSPALQREP